jgi:hypothetical protein
MNSKDNKLFVMLTVVGLVLLMGSIQTAVSQELRWLRVNQLETYLVDYGAESEYGAIQSNFFSWPAQYGDNQYTTRGKGMWLGAKNFYDPVEQKLKSVKVIGAGPRLDPASQPTMIFPLDIKLIGKSYPPKVFVDGQIGSNNTLYDVLDEQDDHLPCERMIVMQLNTSMGVSVTKKVLAFTQPNHDGYLIQDYVFKNTGIYNRDGDVYAQTLNDFWVNFMYRYAFSGVTSSGWGSTWGAFSSEWGASTMYGDFGPYRNPLDTIRGFYSYYGPNKERTSVTYDEDWGCPNQNGGGPNLDGLLGSAKYMGVVTLFASRGPGSLYGTDDQNQPMSTSYFSSDDIMMQSSVSQYDESFMLQRYKRMSEAHLPQSHEEAVGNQYVADWRSAYPDRDAGGGSSQGQGFGPYTLAPGDSIHIVFAEGCSGISWEKCREVGAVWYQYYKGLSSPSLEFPANYTGPTATYTDYTRAWVQTGKDSIMQMLRSALRNYSSGYTLPQPPPPPDEFTVTSGGDRINLKWSANADGAQYFDGYVVWRAEGSVKDYRTVYTKVFECNRANVVHEWDDTSAVRGFNYYYAIQSKDDGSQNDLRPGRPLYSSLVLTLTTTPAHLLRPAGNLLGEVRVVPNPYDIRARAWQFGDQFQYDRITFYGIPPKCKLKIYTENGTLIWETTHTNGSGDEIWDSKTSSGQVVVSGIYILYVEVTEDIVASEDKIAKYDIFDENLNRMYTRGQRMFSRGDKLFSAGQSTFRKFVVIR